MKIWRTKKGADRRLRQGHPWLFASELAHSAKEAEPGELVELLDASDKFLGVGFAHPSSQICFRRLSANAKETDVGSEAFFSRRLKRARELRQSAGWATESHRWLYAEADGVPGLIVDAFRTPESWLVVVQASTAGVERCLPKVYSAIQTFARELPNLTIINSPNSTRRKLEGLQVSDKHVVFGSAEHLEDVELCLNGGVRLHCDLLHGQKTGFFLDQQWNVELLKRLCQFEPGRPLRVLDICCYVGQWAAHTAAHLKAKGHSVEVVLNDASATALKIAERNLKRYADSVELWPADALEALGTREDAFDVVICDPPAFVKKKADLEAGLRAYTKLNRDAMKLVRPQGLFVSASCSGLVKGLEFRQALHEASVKAGRQFTQLLQGGHAPDHPLRPEFPEGEYLKAVLGRIQLPF